MNPDRRDVVEFERTLDAELNSCQTLRFDPVRTIKNAAGAISVAFSYMQPALPNAAGPALCDAFDVMLPILMSRDSQIFPDDAMQVMMADMQFMTHYHALREYLYYTYNVAGSFGWEFGKGYTRITFADQSIPRQFAHMWNSQISDLVPIYQYRDERAQRMHDLLQGAEESGEGDHIQEAFGLAIEEVEVRIMRKFDLLGGESSSIVFEGYAYADFYRVYKYLLAKMVYHQYHARANSTWASFMFPARLLLQELTIGTGVDLSTIKKVLADLTYTRNCGNIQPMYYSMVRHHRSSSYIAIPDLMISGDGLAKFLKVHATKNPSWFASNVSGVLGSSFVDNLGVQIAAAGFNVLKNVQLRRFDPRAPDIDLLVFSREATLGYVVFIIEVKGTIPGLWAKDYIRALDKSNVSKAYGQLEKILKLLGNDTVRDYIANRVLCHDPKPLSSGLMLIHKLIVTSQNAGMFFDEADTQAIDYRTIIRLFADCDGDVSYVLQCLRRLKEGVGFEVTSSTTQVGGRNVIYDVVQMGDPLIFRKNRWKTGGLDEVLAEQFFEEGGELFDHRKHASFKDGWPVGRDDDSS